MSCIQQAQVLSKSKMKHMLETWQEWLLDQEGKREGQVERRARKGTLSHMTYDIKCMSI